MLGYIAAVETVIVERRKRKQKPRVLEFIHPAWVPKVPLGFHILFKKGIIAQAVFLTTICVGSFKGKG